MGRTTCSAGWQRTIMISLHGCNPCSTLREFVHSARVTIELPWHRGVALQKTLDRDDVPVSGAPIDMREPSWRLVAGIAPTVSSPATVVGGVPSRIPDTGGVRECGLTASHGEAPSYTREHLALPLGNRVQSPLAVRA